MGISRHQAPTRFAQIERQRTQRDPSGKVVVLPAPLATARRIEHGEHEGVPFLRAVFPQIGRNQPQIVDLNQLLALPHLAIPFAQAFLEAYSVRASKTRTSAACYLRIGFCSYLLENSLTSVVLADLTTERLNGFVRWLNQVDPVSGRARWAVRTRQSYLVALRIIVQWLWHSAPWSDQIPKNLSLPAFCWPGAKRQAAPTRVLTDSELRAVYRACLTEVLATRKRVAENVRLMQEARCRLSVRPKTYRDYGDLPTCLAALDQAFPDSVPTYEGILARHPFLFRAMQVDHGGVIAVRSILYPNGRALVPFVLLLAIHTRYNPETLLDSNLEDYQIEEQLGQAVLVSRAYKGRSQSRQVSITPVDEAPDNPASIITFLREWTHRARRLAPMSLANRLLLIVPGRKHTSVNDICGAWPHVLRQFCDDHQLKPFSLVQIRPTMLDLGTVLHFGDLRAAQALGNHRSAETTYLHYTSDAQRQRNAEQLGEVMALRTRWRETGGFVDPRERPHDADQGAEIGQDRPPPFG